MSLARLGAEVTGLDLSDSSIQIARELFADTATPGRFEVGKVYDAPVILGERYDLVYIGVGALCWLPNIDRWCKYCVGPTRRRVDKSGRSPTFST